MLGQIIKFAQTSNISSEPGFSTKVVKYAISFDVNGNYLGIVELGNPLEKINKGRSYESCPNLTQSELISGNSDNTQKCHFLIESTAVVALMVKDGEQILDKTVKKHNNFIDLLEEAGSSIQTLKYIAQTLKNADFADLICKDLKSHKAKEIDNVTIAIDGSIILEPEYKLRPLWMDWWREYYKNLKSVKLETTKDNVQLMVDILTGEIVNPVPSHEKIKGLSNVGGLGTGDSMISFDKDSYRSFGLEQSSNAAMSAETVSTYVTAINKLIKEQSKKLFGTIIAYWYDREVNDDLMSFFEKEGTNSEISPLETDFDVKPKITYDKVEQKREELSAIATLNKLLKSIESGNLPDASNAHYHALIVSGNSGRVMVRDYLFASYKEMARNILKWFEDLAISFGQRINEPRMYNILFSLERDPKKTPLKQIESQLWCCALKNEQIPRIILAKAVSKSKIYEMTGSDDIWNQVTRMGLIKAYHLRKNKGGNELSTVNNDHPSVAYQCGRLLAILASLQNAALGDVGAGVIERFYASASSTPALVLGRLTRTSQHHLSKLDKGLQLFYESKLANIWSKLGDSIPKTFNLEDQSLFALGFYQQKENDISERIKNSIEKKANKTKEGEDGSN